MLMSKQVAQPGEVQRSLKKFNVVMVKDNFIPETCKYYLHYTMILADHYRKTILLKK